MRKSVIVIYINRFAYKPYLILVCKVFFITNSVNFGKYKENELLADNVMSL